MTTPFAQTQIKEKKHKLKLKKTKTVKSTRKSDSYFGGQLVPLTWKRPLLQITVI